MFLHPDSEVELQSKAGSPAFPYRLGYALFLLLNAVLFVRPAEIVPALIGLPIFEVVMVACLLATGTGVIRQLRWGELVGSPVSLFMLGLLPAIVLSHLSHGNLWAAREGAISFLKVLLYYLMLVAVVNSPARLRRFLLTIGVFVLAVGALALLRYHGLMELPGMAALERGEGIDPETGQRIVILQLQASGIFSDPNDFSAVLAASIMIFAFMLLDSQRWTVRLACAAAVAGLSYPFALTHSRGGFLALMAGGAALMIARFGWRRAALVGLVLVPGLLVVFGGRQTNIDLSDEGDTAYGRMELWRDGLTFLRQSPLFGIGHNMYAEEAGLVAHNSYIHCYAELGFFGGTLFLGAVYVSFADVWRTGRSRAGAEQTGPMDLELLRWRTCVLSVLAAYAVSIFSISRPYAYPTYFVFGVVVSFLQLVATDMPAARTTLSVKLLRRVLAVSVGFLIFMYLFLRFFLG